MRNIIAQISADLTLPVQLIEDALRLAHIRFRKIRVAKKSGGHRTIVQPSAELKVVHGWLLREVLSKLPVSQIATAFRLGASNVCNAAIHRESKYSVRVDLSDFFPSLTSADLILAISRVDEKLPKFVGDTEFTETLRRACFDKEDQLPIGYPTSPAIANAVMKDFDDALLARIRFDSARFGQSRLTRYADDFVFSTNLSGACAEFVKEITSLIGETKSPRLHINAKKTRYMSRAGGSTLVTGLRINQQGMVRVHPNYRDHVRLLLKHFAKSTLASEEIQQLVGHLAYVEHADPTLFTRLSFRYFKEIASLRAGVAPTSATA